MPSIKGNPTLSPKSVIMQLQKLLLIFGLVFIATASLSEANPRRKWNGRRWDPDRWNGNRRDREDETENDENDQVNSGEDEDSEEYEDSDESEESSEESEESDESEENDRQGGRGSMGDDRRDRQRARKEVNVKVKVKGRKSCWGKDISLLSKWAGFFPETCKNECATGEPIRVLVDADNDCPDEVGLSSEDWCQELANVVKGRQFCTTEVFLVNLMLNRFDFERSESTFDKKFNFETMNFEFDFGRFVNSRENDVGQNSNCWILADEKKISQK